MDREQLARQFESNRERLTAVAYRMLGSAADADDAVQEAWLRLSRSDGDLIDNLGGWLTTVVARVCLDMMRSRKSRSEESLDEAGRASGTDPEREAVLADSVGLALLVVLETLAPAERLAFVLHDMFAVDFDEIARVVGRSPAAARQLASRARRRVQSADVPSEGVADQRRVVDAFLAALRGRDFEGLLAVLDPDVVVRTGEREVRGALNWAKGAINFAPLARFTQVALIDGRMGAILAPRGRLQRALRFTFSGGRIATVEVITDVRGLRVDVV